MKNTKLTNIIAIAFASSILLSACGGGSSSGMYDSNIAEETTLETGSSSEGTATNSSGTDSSLNTDPTGLSSSEIEGLLFMREEEELARDLYMDIYVAKGSRLKTFKNISEKAESKHAEAIRQLLVKYNLEDPSTGVHNTYNDDELQHLYDDLFNIAIGSDDIAALRVGALVEETDIRDINTHKSHVSTEHQNIISTYDNLLCGSRNHLRSFVKQIENRTGQAYQIQVPELDSEVREILNSDQEQCGQ